MALVTTFLTTPLTTALYPEWYQVKVERWRRGEIDWNGNSLQDGRRSDSVTAVKDQLKTVPVRKLLVYLRLDGLSGICTLAALLSPNRAAILTSPRVHPSKLPKQTEEGMEDALSIDDHDEAALRVHGVRLMELTDRDSSVMRVSAGDHALWDPVVNTFRAFGEWHDISLMAGVSVIPEHTYADTVVNMASQETADLLLLPWSESGNLTDRQNGLEVDTASRFADGSYTDFVSSVLRRVSNHVGIFIENSPDSRSPDPKRPPPHPAASGLSIQSVWSRKPSGDRSHHLVLPFLGGEDDRFALRFVLQLAQNDQVTATIIQLPGFQSATASSSKSKSATRDSQSDNVFLESLRDSIPEELKERVIFQQSASQDTISDLGQVALSAVRNELDNISGKSGSIVVVGRNNSLSQGSASVDSSIGTDTYYALGLVASTLVDVNSKIVGSVLVLQASTKTVVDNR